MAKPGRRVRPGLPLSSEVPFATSNDPLDSLLVPTPIRRWNPSSVRSILSDIEDRRTYHPDPVRPVRSLRKWSVPMVAKPPKARRLAQPGRPGRSVSLGFSFQSPRHVLVCVRRSQRREVLHALKKTGKGSGRSKRRRNALSNVRC